MSYPNEASMMNSTFNNDAPARKTISFKSTPDFSRPGPGNIRTEAARPSNNFTAAKSTPDLALLRKEISSVDTSEQQVPSGDAKNLFPWTLFTLLEDAEKHGFDSIVSWRPCGKAFKVLKRDEFMSQVLPRYFKQTKYKSFVRQLNLWGFTCLQDGPDRGAYYHELFEKTNKVRCLEIRRRKRKNDSRVSSLENLAEPYRLQQLYQSFEGEESGKSMIDSINAGMPSPLDRLWMQADADVAAASKVKQSFQTAAPNAGWSTSILRDSLSGCPQGAGQDYQQDNSEFGGRNEAFNMMASFMEEAPLPSRNTVHNHMPLDISMPLAMNRGANAGRNHNNVNGGYINRTPPTQPDDMAVDSGGQDLHGIIRLNDFFSSPTRDTASNAEWGQPKSMGQRQQQHQQQHQQYQYQHQQPVDSLFSAVDDFGVGMGASSAIDDRLLEDPSFESNAEDPFAMHMATMGSTADDMTYGMGNRIDSFHSLSLFEASMS